jgi:hypothetical protein
VDRDSLGTADSIGGWLMANTEDLVGAFQSAGRLVNRVHYLASKLQEHDVILEEAVTLLFEHQQAHGLAKDHEADEATQWRERRDAVLNYVLTAWGDVVESSHG